MPRPRFSVQRRFIALISCAVILTSGLLSAYYFIRWKEDEMEEISEKGQTLALSLAQNCEYGVLFSDIPQLELLAKVAAEDVDVSYVTIYDEKGVVLAEVHGKPLVPYPEQGSRRSIVREQGQDKEAIVTYFEYGSNRIPALDIVRPILIEKVARHREELELMWETGDAGGASAETRVIGHVQLGLSLEKPLAQLREIRRNVGILTLAVIVSGVLLTIPFARLIVRPIRQLVDATQKIAQGDLSQNVEARTKDEIGDLAHSFNQMVADLKSSRNEVEEYSRTLERKVEERTAELARANERLKSELTERERAEKELQEFAARLERSNRELTHFAYIASHDLREPLRKIQAFGDRLVSKCRESLPEEGRDYLDRMQSASERMQDLIDGLLTFSRVTTKAQPFSPVDLTKVAREVLSDLEVTIEQTGGRVELGDLPTIDADPLQMRQLLQNLIGNALKFHRNEETPLVKVSAQMLNGEKGRPGAESSNSLCQVVVEDNGIGFDEKHCDRIFEVFQRLHGRSEYKGSGVGLAVCKKIAERHGGSITAKSVPGQGATFIVTLPVKQPKGGNIQWNDTEPPSRS